MNPMKIAAIAGLSLVVIFLAVQAFSFVGQVNQLNASYAQAENELTKAQAEETNLQDEQQYLANPANLEKELRARFNYVNPGEKMIIITPVATGTASDTSVSD